MPRRHHASKAPDVGDKVTKDIRSLNASILIISQKMKYLVRNEKILGRNLLVLNKRLKEIATSGESASEKDFSDLRGAVAELSKDVSSNRAALSELWEDVSGIKEKSATKETVHEIKYLLESINPLEFTTMKDVEAAIDKRLLKHGKK